MASRPGLQRNNVPTSSVKITVPSANVSLPLNESAEDAMMGRNDLPRSCELYA